MNTYKFIKNDIGEVVNVDKITAITFDQARAPYEIRVYTPSTKFGASFHYETIEKMCKALNNLDRMMNLAHNLRIIKFANWMIAADAVESISRCAHGIRVRMDDGQNFDIMIENREDVKEAQQEIEESLIEMYSMMDLEADNEE